MADFLIAPLAAAAALAGYMIYAEPKTIHVSDIVVTKSLVDKGYTGRVVSRHLGDVFDARSKQANIYTVFHELRLESDHSVAEELAHTIHVLPIIRAAQRSLHLIDYELDGDVTEHANRYEMRLRMRTAGGDVVSQIESNKDDIAGMIDRAARRILVMTAPQVECVALFREEREAAKKEMKEARKCLEEGLPFAKTLRAKRALPTLAGLIAWTDGDVAGAEKHYKDALLADPGFYSALINLGVLAQMRGDHVAAEAYLRKSVLRKPPEIQREMRAVGLARLGVSLAAQGKRQEAEGAFVEAELEDGQSVELYTQWSKVMRGWGDAARADMLEARAKSLKGREGTGQLGLLMTSYAQL